MHTLRSTLRLTLLATFAATASLAQMGEQTPAQGLDLLAGDQGTVIQNGEDITWRLTELNGQPFPMDANSKEPHIVFETGDTQSFRATIGCNQMHGQYTLDGNTLSFSPVAMTMMACPPPLDTLENQFTKTLSEIIGFDVAGSTLALNDQDGKTRALFTAQYF